ncbi:acetylglutamate kinase [Clostridium botulinum]|uniref:acetylglutamate kinase n=1 Tax=Clostridium botulinum TaxID=1491 RepID=UPI000174E88E|nr:acetylglutamate kinase [Clostridium botulinum]ACD53811.1 acetylglutamate kinase [Clostridium botulinum E3 str. Alaska E43]AJF30682.1 acetylglutamate kinase [Clostridium botulinum]AJF33745.1 acetylglutamate kinase [Clostridium botulinum]MBN1049788.1 acetylglutamate kinase [Clostridium botulinum]MBN1059723.1 acetylglutamate kinase [Clostridium botulinum]
MNHNERAKILVNALPYIQKYYGKTIVVKYGGNAMISDELKETVINDIILMKCVGIDPVIVHGGGPDISDFLDKLGKQSEFINGLRYTDEDTMEIVQMVLGGKVNKNLVSLIETFGGKAIGLCGMDGSLIRAKKLEKDIDLGYVGEITKIDTNILKTALNAGYIPVVGSVALGEDDNKAYNINADICASKISSALNAEKLILLTDVPGVLVDPKDSTSLLNVLRLHQIPKLCLDGIIKGGMIPKIDCCVEAIRMGVERTHIIDGRVPHSLILELFSNEGIGTMIY